MKSFKQFIKENSDYYSEHRPAQKSDGAPLHDITQNGVYPNDVYSTLHHYSTNQDYDKESISIIHQFYKKPNAKVTIYRAIPHTPSNQESISEIIKHKAYILKYGKIHPSINTPMNTYQYFDHLNQKLNHLQSPPNQNIKKISINPGDWVTISKKYASEHGENNLNNKFKIIQKTVPAKHIFTDGNHLSEWGYDPSK